VTEPSGRRVFDETVKGTEAVVGSGIRGGTEYEILVTAVNDAGRGPAARVRFATAAAAAAVDGPAAEV